MHATILKYFVEVARSGSVRKASEKLYVRRQRGQPPDPEAGRRARRRTVRPPAQRHALNPAGERLLKHVQETLHGFQVMRGELDALKGERTGHVKLATMDSFFIEFLPAAVEEFLQIFPAVTYTIAALAPMDVPQAVLSGQTDVGLTFVSRLPAGVVAVALAHMPLGIVMSPGHPLEKFERISLKECARYPFLRSSSHPVVSSSMSPEFFRFWDEMEPAATCNSRPCSSA